MLALMECFPKIKMKILLSYMRLKSLMEQMLISRRGSVAIFDHPVTFESQMTVPTWVTQERQPEMLNRAQTNCWKSRANDRFEGDSWWVPYSFRMEADHQKQEGMISSFHLSVLQLSTPSPHSKKKGAGDLDYDWSCLCNKASIKSPKAWV